MKTKIFRRPDRLSATCKNVKYPKAALNNGSEGKVNLAFLVGECGDVLDTAIVQSSGDQDLDIEARDSLSLCKFSFPANAGVKEMWTTYQFLWILN